MGGREGVVGGGRGECKLCITLLAWPNSNLLTSNNAENGIIYKMFIVYSFCLVFRDTYIFSFFFNFLLFTRPIFWCRKPKKPFSWVSYRSPLKSDALWISLYTCVFIDIRYYRYILVCIISSWTPGSWFKRILHWSLPLVKYRVTHKEWDCKDDLEYSILKRVPSNIW